MDPADKVNKVREDKTPKSEKDAKKTSKKSLFGGLAHVFTKKGASEKETKIGKLEKETVEKPDLKEKKSHKITTKHPSDPEVDKLYKSKKEKLPISTDMEMGSKANYEITSIKLQIASFLPNSTQDYTKDLSTEQRKNFNEVVIHILKDMPKEMTAFEKEKFIQGAVQYFKKESTLPDPQKFMLLSGPDKAIYLRRVIQLHNAEIDKNEISELLSLSEKHLGNNQKLFEKAFPLLLTNTPTKSKDIIIERAPKENIDQFDQFIQDWTFLSEVYSYRALKGCLDQIPKEEIVSLVSVMRNFHNKDIYTPERDVSHFLTFLKLYEAGVKDTDIEGIINGIINNSPTKNYSDLQYRNNLNGAIQLFNVGFRENLGKRAREFSKYLLNGQAEDIRNLIDDQKINSPPLIRFALDTANSLPDMDRALFFKDFSSLYFISEEIGEGLEYRIKHDPDTVKANIMQLIQLNKQNVPLNEINDILDLVTAKNVNTVAQFHQKGYSEFLEPLLSGMEGIPLDSYENFFEAFQLLLKNEKVPQTTSGDKNMVFCMALNLPTDKKEMDTYISNCIELRKKIIDDTDFLTLIKNTPSADLNKSFDDIPKLIDAKVAIGDIPQLLSTPDSDKQLFIDNPNLYTNLASGVSGLNPIIVSSLLPANLKEDLKNKKIIHNDELLSEPQYLDAILNSIKRKFDHPEGTDQETLIKLGNFVYNAPERLGLFEEHPLVQDALQMVIINEVAGPKNPFSLYKLHLELAKQPITYQPEKFQVAGQMVSFNLEGFQALSEVVGVRRENLPEEATFEAWQTFLNAYKERAKNEENAKAIENRVAETTVQQLLVPADELLSNLMKLSEGKASDEEAEWKKVFSYILTLDNTPKSPGPLSEQEEWFTKIMGQIVHCPDGQKGGIYDAYSILPKEFKYPIELSLRDEVQEAALITGKKIFEKAKSKNITGFVKAANANTKEGSKLAMLIGFDKKFWHFTSVEAEKAGEIPDPEEHLDIEWHLTEAGAEKVLEEIFESSKKHISEIVHDYMHNQINRNNDILDQLTTFRGQDVHVTKYVKNRIGRHIGLGNEIRIDKFSEAIPSDLLEKSPDKVLKIVLDHTDLVSELIKSVDVKNHKELKDLLPETKYWEKKGDEEKLSQVGALELLKLFKFVV